jgi:RNA polymerase sigma factor (sigma-70 family)
MPDPLPLEKPPENSESEDTINRRATKLYQAYMAGACNRDEYLNAVARLVYQPLVSYIFHRTRFRASYEDQEDIFQQVLMRFFEVDPNLSDIPLLGWLFSVTRNLLVDRWRRMRIRKEMLFDDKNCSHGVSLHPAETREWFIEHAIRDAMKSLPWEYAFALDMCFWQGYTQIEVAEMLAKPRSTVEYYIRSAMQRLREDSQLKKLNLGGQNLSGEQS